MNKTRKSHIDSEEYIRNIDQVTKEQILKIAKSVQINTIYFLTNQQKGWTNERDR